MPKKPFDWERFEDITVHVMTGDTWIAPFTLLAQPGLGSSLQMETIRQTRKAPLSSLIEQPAAFLRGQNEFMVKRD